MAILLFRLEVCVMQLGTFQTNQDYEQITFYIRQRLFFIARSVWGGKSTPIYIWLKIGTFQLKFNKQYFFINTLSQFSILGKKRLKFLSLLRGVNFEFIDMLKNNVITYLVLFYDSFEEICISKAFVDISTCFIWANWGNTLSAKSHTKFSSSLPVMWCKSVCFINNWCSDQTWLVGIETQRLFPTVNFWLICRHEQVIDYVIVQTLDSFSRKFFYPRTVKAFKVLGRWTHQFFPITKCSNRSPANAIVFSSSPALKSSSGFSSNT